MTSIFGVVADDFTGACDVGVQFSKYGLKTVVLTDLECLPSLKGEFDVVVIDTETRNITPEAAYRKVRETLRTLEKTGVKLVYKKIDSTLRGNIGAELDAVLDELGLRAVVVAPSFPACNRTVLNGRLLIGTQPLEETEFAHDLLNPLYESHVPTLIEGQTKRRVAHVSLPQVRGGVEQLGDGIKRLIEDGGTVIVADAETKEDLANIAKASMSSDILLSGSAGLAEEFSRLLTRGSGLLVVCGSINTVTIEQVAEAERQLGVKVLEPNLSGVLVSDEKLGAAARDLAGRVEEYLTQDKDVITRLAGSKDPILKIQELGKQLGMSPLQVADRLLLVLSESFKRIAARQKLVGLILVGGDTSIRIMNAVGAKGVSVEDEVLPGVPAGRILGGKYEGMRMVTKAGGFGDRYALVKIMRYMKSNERFQ